MSSSDRVELVPAESLSWGQIRAKAVAFFSPPAGHSHQVQALNQACKSHASAAAPGQLFTRFLNVTWGHSLSLGWFKIWISPLNTHCGERAKKLSRSQPFT